MTRKIRQIWRASWQYLNQHIVPDGSESIWKPSRFWYMYKLKFLETCWNQEPVVPSHENRGQDEYRTGN
jgi:hypothetical protein